MDHHCLRDLPSGCRAWIVTLLPPKVCVRFVYFRMAGVSIRRVFSKTARTPRRPYEAQRILDELKLCGVYGLKNKREVYRVDTQVSKIRTTARDLLKEDESSPRRAFEGPALLRRLQRYGILETSKNKLDYVLSLTVEDFLNRRLQTIVKQKNLASSIHQARCMIEQGHIRVGDQIVTNPGFMVRLSQEQNVDLVATSTLNENSGKHGRRYRKHHRQE